MQTQHDQTRSAIPSIATKSVASARYGIDNPPLSEESAATRIETLVGEIQVVETDLEMSNPETYAGLGTYAEWRKRAVSALGHIKKELKFLRRWVDQQRVAKKAAKRQVADESAIRNYEGLGIIARGIKARAIELAVKIGGAYEVRYRESVSPPDLLTAIARRTELVAIKESLGDAFQEITAAWTSHPLRREEMGVAKAPLNKILKCVERELGVIKVYIAQSTPRQPTPVAGWKTICIGFFERMLENGADLTQEEVAVLVWLKATKMPA